MLLASALDKLASAAEDLVSLHLCQGWKGVAAGRGCWLLEQRTEVGSLLAAGSVGKPRLKSQLICVVLHLAWPG